MNFAAPVNLPRPEQLLNAQRVRLQGQADKLFTAVTTELEAAIARASLVCPSVSVRDYDFVVRNFVRTTFEAQGWHITGADTWVFAAEPDVLKVAKEEPEAKTLLEVLAPDPAYVPYARVHGAKVPTGWTEPDPQPIGASVIDTGALDDSPPAPPAPPDPWQKILAEESARGNPTRYIVVPRDVVPEGVGMELWDSKGTASNFAQQTNQGTRLWTPDAPETLGSYNDEGGWDWAIVDLHQVYAKELVP